MTTTYLKVYPEMKTGQNTPLSQCEEREAKSYSQELLPSPVPLGKEHTPTP